MSYYTATIEGTIREITDFICTVLKNATSDFIFEELFVSEEDGDKYLVGTFNRGCVESYRMTRLGIVMIQLPLSVRIIVETNEDSYNDFFMVDRICEDRLIDLLETILSSYDNAYRGISMPI